MGAGRSLRKLVEQYKQQTHSNYPAGLPPTTKPNTLFFWSNKFEWVAAAQAFDKALSQQKLDEAEARWRKEVMPEVEVLGRLSQMARVNLADIVILDRSGHISGYRQEALREQGYLIRKVSSSEGKTDSVGIEVYDAQSALDKLARVLGLYKNESTNLNIDLSQLNDEQLERIANGEDPVHVLATSGEG